MQACTSCTFAETVLWFVETQHLQQIKFVQSFAETWFAVGLWFAEATT
jgi:hypothetical protein